MIGIEMLYFHVVSHRIFQVRQELQDHQIQPSTLTLNHYPSTTIHLPQCQSTHFLNTPGMGTPPPISLSQCLTILSMKKFFLISHLNFPGTTCGHYVRIHTLSLEAFVVVNSSAYCLRSSKGGLCFFKTLDITFGPANQSDIILQCPLFSCKRDKCKLPFFLSPSPTRPVHASD